MDHWWADVQVMEPDMCDNPSSVDLIPTLFFFFVCVFILKVEDSWKQTEFIVLPHRDSKDVFILGGIDDIQALLDDSMVEYCRRWMFSSRSIMLY